ncbi:Trm112 family protein [Kitasatospora sp. NBC_01539]|uniref:Trm112 family protein n=1 Tax=Kitasatospora sp. NBC_01539 TaxID=2903577 RepID=UPI0038601AFB
MSLPPFLLEILACPQCHAPLAESSDQEQPELRCTGDGCGLIYPVRDEIPVLLVDEARRPS